MKASMIVISAMVSALVGSVVARADQAATRTVAGEKCYGIAKAGLNDCQTASHSCAGASTKDSDGVSWIYVPVGTCQKITGGSVTPKA
jgi:uncharacterized membrane protein